MKDERVHPTAAPAAARPIPPPPKSINGAPTKPPPGPNNPTPRRRPTSYRPATAPSRSGRRCTCRRLCCLCFLYTLIALLCLILLAAVAGTIFYFFYHPKHPSFSVSSLLITTFNLSASSSSSSLYPHVTSRLDLTLLSKNPNTKLITFFYDPVTVSASTEGAVDLGNSTLPGFVSVPGNVTVLAANVDSDPTKGQDPESVSQLRADLGKNGFPVDVGLETQVRVRIGKMRSKSVGIRISCVGIRGYVPSPAKKNGTAAAAVAVGEKAQGKCKVDLRLKIWKFTLF